MNNQLSIKVDRNLVSLQNDDILFIQSKGDYVMLFTTGRKYITHSTTKAMADQVNPQVFARVHRSFIVNLTKINDIQEDVLYINGKTIPISKTHKPQVMEKVRK